MILLLLIALIGITLLWQLHYFVPGLLGRITCYIFTRQIFPGRIKGYSVLNKLNSHQGFVISQLKKEVL